ncbi:MAG: GH3 auxin-responsive promoter family protein, partial [Bdellovibrio sp.]
DLRHYFLSPLMKEGKACYHWTLFVPAQGQAETDVLAQALDKEMRKINGDYDDCRAVGVLGPAQVTLINADYLQKYFEQNRHRGQFKMKTTFETAEEYLQFMRSHIEAKETLQ